MSRDAPVLHARHGQQDEHRQEGDADAPGAVAQEEARHELDAHGGAEAARVGEAGGAARDVRGVARAGDVEGQHGARKQV